MKSTKTQEIEEQEFFENIHLLPSGFILIKHPTPNLSLVEINEDRLKELNKAKWIAAIDYNTYRGHGLTINRDGIQSTFKYFVTGETAQEAVSKLVKITLSKALKGVQI